MFCSCLLEQIGVGDDHLLAGDRADPGALEADLLDRAGGLVEADRVAAAERLVEDDRERREQVREDALGGEADGDAADAEAGDQAGDVDAEIVEDEDDRDANKATVTSRRMMPIAEPRPCSPRARRRGARPSRGSARAPRSPPAGGGDDEEDVDDRDATPAGACACSATSRAEAKTMKQSLVLASTRARMVRQCAVRRDRCGRSACRASARRAARATMTRAGGEPRMICRLWLGARRSMSRPERGRPGMSSDACRVVHDSRVLPALSSAPLSSRNRSGRAPRSRYFVARGMQGAADRFARPWPPRSAPDGHRICG